MRTAAHRPANECGGDAHAHDEPSAAQLLGCLQLKLSGRVRALAYRNANERGERCVSHLAHHHCIGHIIHTQPQSARTW